MADATTVKKLGRGGSVPKAESAGPIEATAVYSLSDFKKRTRWSDHAIRTAKRQGLTVLVAGGVGMVRGKDFHAYLAKLAGDPQDGK